MAPCLIDTLTRLFDQLTGKEQICQQDLKENKTSSPSRQIIHVLLLVLSLKQHDAKKVLHAQNHLSKYICNKALLLVPLLSVAAVRVLPEPVF